MIEKRRPLTRAEFGQLMVDQGGRCACPCREKLQPLTEGVIDEHRIPLALGGSNDLSNRELWRKPCAAAKTAGQDAPAIAKAKRQAGEKGQRARREKRGGGSIKSKGFGSVARGFDGKVKLTAKARRAAAVNDDVQASPASRSGSGA